MRLLLHPFTVTAKGFRGFILSPGYAFYPHPNPLPEERECHG